MSFEYKQASDEYLEKRTLRRHARVLHLWALGVGAASGFAAAAVAVYALTRRRGGAG